MPLEALEGNGITELSVTPALFAANLGCRMAHTLPRGPCCPRGVCCRGDAERILSMRNGLAPDGLDSKCRASEPREMGPRSIAVPDPRGERKSEAPD